MKYAFLVSALLLLGSLSGSAQNRVDVEVGPVFKPLITEFDSCIKIPSRNCEALADALIQKGKAEKVPFLDYLYFKKAFYFMNRNELDSALKYARLTLENPNPTERQRNDLDAKNLIAGYHYYQGRLDSALHYFLEIAAVMEKGGDPLHLGYLYSNIANLLGETGNDDGQIEYLHKSYKLLDENKDQQFIATVAGNLSLGYYYKKDTPEVKKWAGKALQLSAISNDLVAQSIANFTLSLVTSDLQKALQYAEASKSAAEALEDKVWLASSYYRYAEVLHQLGQSEKALPYARKAVEYAEEMGDNLTRMRAAATAAKILYQSGQKAAAADYYYTYSLFKDSIATAEAAREINELATRYETEKKDRQLTEHRLVIETKNAQMRGWAAGGLALLLAGVGFGVQYRKSQSRKFRLLERENENAVLKALMRGEEQERNRISKDLHDGIAAMLGAARMSLQSMPYLTDEKRTAQLEKVALLIGDTHAEVRRIAHDLLPVVLEKEGLIPALKQFAAGINQLGILEVHLENNLSPDLSFSPPTALMLYRIVQELVNNVIKHAGATEVRIQLAQDARQLFITVADNGVGFSEAAENQGLHSIRGRLQSIGGDFRVSGEKGCTARLSLDLARV